MKAAVTSSVAFFQEQVDRGCFPLAFFLYMELDTCFFGRDFRDNRDGPVSTAARNDNDLCDADRWSRLGQYCMQCARDIGLFFICPNAMLHPTRLSPSTLCSFNCCGRTSFSHRWRWRFDS